jgi:hypothetical protein
MRGSLSTDCRTLLPVRERVRVAKDDSEYDDKRQIKILRALLRTIFLAAVTAEACFLLNAENVNVRALKNKLQSVALFEQFKYLVSGHLQYRGREISCFQQYLQNIEINMCVHPETPRSDQPTRHQI